MWPQWRNPKLYLMLFSDAALFVLAHVLAYLLRFEFEIPSLRVQQIKMILPYAIPLKLFVFYMFGLYRGMWRYTSMEDFWQLAQACVLSSLLIVTGVLYFNRFVNFSRSVFPLDGFLTFLLTGGLRMMIRSVHSLRQDSSTPRGLSVPWLRNKKRGGKRVLLIGAGSSGEKILREILENPELGYQVIGFLDDDPGKLGRSLHGVRVLGSIEELPEVVQKHRIEQSFIAISKITGSQMRRIVDICKSCDAPFKTLPGMREIMKGKVSIKTLRDVNYQDLLRRPPVRLDTDEIMGYLTERSILVTGCGGSIGSELCRQLVRFNPGALILIDASEPNLFHIQMELHHDIQYRNYHCILGKIQDKPLMEKVFCRYRPDVVFHAAAYKHVPLLEKNPWEGVFNNIMGSRVLMEMASNHGTKRFVLVSTDKAVRPTNVMGATKRITELLLQSFQGGDTRFMAVRFGNVIGSSGSVIPLFRRQIELGGPVTVTHPEVTRYFMTIPEAAQLILQAGAMGVGDEIFILEMGTPIKIAEMARDLIQFSGKEPGKDIEILFTGLREGEKLYEELITEGEGIVGTHHEKIMVLRSNGYCNGHHDQTSFCKWLGQRLDELYSIAAQHDAWGIKKKLNEIVPEYVPQDTDCVL